MIIEINESLSIETQYKILGKNERHHCTLFNNCSIGILKVTPEGRAISINKHLIEMLGYSSQKKLTSDISLKRLIAYFLKNENSFTTTLKKEKGDTIWIEITKWQITDVEGNVLYYEGTVKEITGQHKLIKKLKESEARSRLLLENTGTAIMVIEEDTIISKVNRQMEKLSRYTKDEIERKMSWTNLIAEDKQLKKLLKYHNERRNITNQDLAPNSYETKIIDKRGNKRDVVVNVNIIPDTKKSIVSLIDISELNKKNKKIHYLNCHDKLTGLYNRNYFEKKIKELNTKDNLPLSIIVGDVNGLKLINDAFGHKKGDDLLKIIAKILKNNCRKGDIVSRWGGDEFVILLPKTSYEITKEICKRINKRCDEAKTELIHPSIALGFSTKSNEKQNIRSLLKDAENWMYKNKLTESKSARSSIIKSLEETLLEKNYETEEHAKRLKELAIRMGKALDLPNHCINDLILLASLHDIGKIAIDDSILLKPGELSAEEWESMKKHSEIGYRIAKSSTELASISEGILCHHEWWNGTGYPNGLKGEEIPLISRIISIIDAYDVMIHDRPYKKAFSHEEAVRELHRCAGTQFDPELVEVFINIGKKEYSVLKDDPDLPCKLKEEIAVKREELHVLMENKNKFDEEVLKKSQELDRLINKFNDISI